NVSARGGDEKIKATARAALAEHKDAVISVKYAGFIAHQFDGKLDKQEFTGEATGTVLSPNGLTALCLGTINMTQSPVFVAQGAKTATAFTEFTFLFGDGRKMPAKLVFVDEKIGVVFAAPTTKQTKLKHVALEKRKLPEILDQLIVLNRLPENLDRAAEIGIGRVTAVLKKPQTALVTEFSFDGGFAVFDSAGHPVGLGVLRMDKNGNGTASGNPGRLIVLPAEALNIGKHLETIKLWDKGEK